MGKQLCKQSETADTPADPLRLPDRNNTGFPVAPTSQWGPVRIEPGEHSCTGPWFVVSMRKRWHGGTIDRSKKPTMVHTSLASAFTEARQLSRLHPKQHYAVFECIGYIKGTWNVLR